MVVLSVQFPKCFQVVLYFYPFFFSQWRFQEHKLFFVSSYLMFLHVCSEFLPTKWSLLPFQVGVLEFYFGHYLLLSGLPQFPMGEFHGELQVAQFVGAYRAQLSLPKLFLYGLRPCLLSILITHGD
jgi:hypothetical protein